MTDLRSCPFCGKVPVAVERSNWSGRHFIRCKNPWCRVDVRAMSDESAVVAIAAWNTRADTRRKE